MYFKMASKLRQGSCLSISSAGVICVNHPCLAKTNISEGSRSPGTNVGTISNPELLVQAELYIGDCRWPDRSRLLELKTKSPRFTLLRHHRTDKDTGSVRGSHRPVKTQEVSR